MQGAQPSVSADAAIVALPRTRAAALIEPLDRTTAARALKLRDTPIVNLHVVYDRSVCELPFVAGVGSPVQYVFDRSDAGGVDVGMPVPSGVAVGRRRGDGHERRGAA